MSETLHTLTAGERIVFGGNRVTHVTPELAAAFQPGDRLVVVHETGDLLHLPHAQHALAAAAVTNAAEAFAAMTEVTDAQITQFFHHFAEQLADDAAFQPIAAANEADVADAQRRGRATGRLTLSAAMRADMIAGLRTWRDIATVRSQLITELSVEKL